MRQLSSPSTILLPYSDRLARTTSGAPSKAKKMNHHVSVVQGIDYDKLIDRFGTCLPARKIPWGLAAWARACELGQAAR